MTKKHNRSLLAFAALGIVYGDIGTSPLYALKMCFYGSGALSVSQDNVLGVLSLIFWALLLVISFKYLFVVLNADQDGEGGVLALTQIVLGSMRKKTNIRFLFLVLGLFGSALLYGDGVLTPAISVLSAVEGLDIATPALNEMVLPIAIGILIGLFSIQRFGTKRISNLFSPVMSVWFVTLAVTGLIQIFQEPIVLEAVNPMYAIKLLTANTGVAAVILGAVFLVVTGGEALYADMGHLGKSAIRRSWFMLVLPSLLLNYMGQGALIIGSPATVSNPFYHMVDEMFIIPMVVLSTMATIIASQAVISGVFSLTFQAVQLGYLPRLRIRHTSPEERGQVYLPLVNTILMCCVIIVILIFGSSENLSVAYGIAISLTMILTDVLIFMVMKNKWRFPFVFSILFLLFYLVSDSTFFGANMLHVLEGGWLPLGLAVIVFTLFRVWMKGNKLVERSIQHMRLKVETFLGHLKNDKLTNQPGTMIALTSDPNKIPLGLYKNMEHNKVRHENILLTNIRITNQPRVPIEDKLQVEKLEDNVIMVVYSCGYMENIRFDEVIKLFLERQVLKSDKDLTVLISRIHLHSSKRKRGLNQIEEQIFIILAKTQLDTATYFNIESKDVLEVGVLLDV